MGIKIDFRTRGLSNSWEDTILSDTALISARKDAKMKNGNAVKNYGNTNKIVFKMAFQVIKKGNFLSLLAKNKI